MYFRKLRGLILASIFLFQISQVFALELYTDGEEYYRIIPNKTYKGEVCIGDLQPNYYYLFKPTINYKIINNFTMSEVFLNNNNLDKYCNSFEFTANEYKYDNSTIPSFITVREVKSLDENSGMALQLRTNIRMDTESMTYKNLLLEMSSKFLLFFVSLFSIFGLLLYIIKSKKFNG